MIKLLLFFFLIFGVSSIAYAEYIDLSKIIKIESNGNPLAYNKYSGARGLCQITPICLKEWNNYHKNNQYTLNCLWIPSINKKIAIWYLEKRIPQMLKFYGLEINYYNIIVCYNAGIAYLVKNKPLKKETIDYIKHYERRK